MTSNGTQECFVYITLPGETAFVTAGRYELSETRAGVAPCKFVYGRIYLARDNAVPIDPLELKLGGTTYETTKHRPLRTPPPSLRSLRRATQWNDTWFTRFRR